MNSDILGVNHHVVVDRSKEFAEINRFGRRLLENIRKNGKEKTNIGIRTKIRYQLLVNELNQDRHFGIIRDRQGNKIEGVKPC